MPTARRPARTVSFDAEAAFAAQTRLINDQRFVIDRLQRDVADLQGRHRQLLDAYCKHVHHTHLSIEARLAAAGIDDPYDDADQMRADAALGGK